MCDHNNSNALSPAATRTTRQRSIHGFGGGAANHNQHANAGPFPMSPNSQHRQFVFCVTPAAAEESESRSMSPRSMSQHMFETLQTANLRMPQKDTNAASFGTLLDELAESATQEALTSILSGMSTPTCAHGAAVSGQSSRHRHHRYRGDNDHSHGSNISSEEKLPTVAGSTMLSTKGQPLDVLQEARNQQDHEVFRQVNAGCDSPVDDDNPLSNDSLGQLRSDPDNYIVSPKSAVRRRHRQKKLEQCFAVPERDHESPQ